ncbi:hypothetical protein ABEB36_004498 [Hypothenemus hampei]|uniref:Uncharacterized protein n=1 Tax=Hypothenemus hampei TaxID=57062 RepID=A0ABD1F6L9_HYPHA
MDISNIDCSDSDSEMDSVCFGPYTMKEARWDIKHGKPRHISERHSSQARYHYWDVSSDYEDKVCKLMENLNTNISNASQYVTAASENETSAVTNEYHETRNSQHTSYNTAVSDFQNNSDNSIVAISDDSFNDFQYSHDVKAEIQETSYSSREEIISLSDSNEFEEESRSEMSLTHAGASTRSVNELENLDDTLEEMNRFLEQGSNYIMPEKSPKKQDTREYNSSDSDSALAKSEKSFPSKNLKPPFPPQDDCQYLTNNEKLLKNSSKIPVSALGTFKIPRSVQNTPQKFPKPHLKNIVSPVGVYIKNTPQYSQLIKTTTQLKKIQPTFLHLARKENVAPQGDIPMVVYKPAKSKIASVTQDVKLPKNIQKLISPRVVTKHEGRIELKSSDVSIRRKLSDSNLTINDSLLSNPDTSILTHKQPFQLNYKQKKN